MKIWREEAERKENMLSRFASKSFETKGRQVPEVQCNIRTAYERDADRILYSMDFRRLRHKTQVFFNAKNDHICTRMEHVLYVSSIACTIARALNLNRDLTYAIALGHDLGHAPFGHTGEKTLNACIRNVNPEKKFMHEIHSLRVVDRLAARVSSGKLDESGGLNLTFEVRDGIVSHCGEKMDEYSLKRNQNKMPADIEDIKTRATMPATLEGCVVRLADKIAYVGRDIEDAVRVNLMNKEDIPDEIAVILGRFNGDIINTLVSDVIENSYEKDEISLSHEKGQALSELIKTNYKKIYKNELISRYEKQVKNMIEGLFDDFMFQLKDPLRLANSNIKVHKAFERYIKENAYEKNTDKEDMVVDFLAGMTDNYATKSFEEIYWM